MYVAETFLISQWNIAMFIKLKLKLPLAPVIYCYLIMWSMYISYSYSFPLQINTFYKFCFYFKHINYKHTSLHIVCVLVNKFLGFHLYIKCTTVE